MQWLHTYEKQMRSGNSGYREHCERVREVHHHHTTFAPVINVQGGKDPHKTGQIVGAAVAHHLAKAGHIVNAALGPGLTGNAVSSAH